MVVLQHATESLTALDFAISGSCIIARLNQLIAQSLMVPFGVVMGQCPASTDESNSWKCNDLESQIPGVLRRCEFG